MSTAIAGCGRGRFSWRFPKVVGCAARPASLLWKVTVPLIRRVCCGFRSPPTDKRNITIQKKIAKFTKKNVVS